MSVLIFIALVVGIGFAIGHYSLKKKERKIKLYISIFLCAIGVLIYMYASSEFDSLVNQAEYLQSQYEYGIGDNVEDTLFKNAKALFNNYVGSDKLSAQASHLQSELETVSFVKFTGLIFVFLGIGFFISYIFSRNEKFVLQPAINTSTKHNPLTTKYNDEFDVMFDSYVLKLEQSKKLLENRILSDVEYEEKRVTVIRDYLGSNYTRQDELTILNSLMILLEKNFITLDEIETYKKERSKNTTKSTAVADQFPNTMYQSLIDIGQLYRKGIYSEEDFNSKKNLWIDELRMNRSISIDGEKFLLSLTDAIGDNLLTNEEIKEIKYITIGSYFDDRDREVAIEKQREIEAQRIERSKKIETVKNLINVRISKMKAFFTTVWDKNVDFCKNLNTTIKTKIVNGSIKQLVKKHSKYLVICISILVIVFGVVFFGVQVNQSKLQGQWKQVNLVSGENQIYLITFQKDNTIQYITSNNEEQKGIYKVNIGSLQFIINNEIANRKLKFINKDEFVFGDFKFIRVESNYFSFLKQTDYDIEVTNGEFSEGGFFSGSAKFFSRFKSHLVYEGEILINKKVGNGKEYWPNGTIRYDGSFDADRFSGEGTLYSDDGKLIYQGDFQEGLFHGKGKLYSSTGEIEYEGDFYNNYPVKDVHNLEEISAFLIESQYNNYIGGKTSINGNEIEVSTYEQVDKLLLQVHYLDFTKDGIDDLVVYNSQNDGYPDEKLFHFITIKNGNYYLVPHDLPIYDDYFLSIRESKGILEILTSTSGGGGRSETQSLIGYNGNEISLLIAFRGDTTDASDNYNLAYQIINATRLYEIDGLSHFAIFSTTSAHSDTSSRVEHSLTPVEFYYDSSTHQYIDQPIDLKILLPKLINYNAKVISMDELHAGDIVGDFFVEYIKYPNWNSFQNYELDYLPIALRESLSSGNPLYEMISWPELVIGLSGNLNADLELYYNYDDLMSENEGYFVSWDDPDIDLSKSNTTRIGTILMLSENAESAISQYFTSGDISRIKNGEGVKLNVDITGVSHNHSVTWDASFIDFVKIYNHEFIRN